MKDILKTLGEIAEIAGGNKYDFFKQIEWAIENKDHPVIKKLHEEIQKQERGDIRIGMQIAMGIVVEALSKQRTDN